MLVFTAPAKKRSRRALAQAALVGLAAASITVIAGQAAQAADPPAAPNNIVVFPQRDFVTIEGYQGRVGQQATVTVTRNGVETSRAVGRVAAGDVALEINHPGGVCWQGVTPDIKPNDVVRVTFPGGASDSTRTQRPEVTPQADGAGFRKVGAFDLVVEGTRGTVPLSRIEQRIVNPDMDPTEIGRRDIRAPSRPGPYTSTLTAPTSTTFRATYHFVTDRDTTAAEATSMRDLAAEGQMRALSWQVTDGAGNRQGLTISEFGEVGGPGFGGCPLGPSTAAPNAPTGVTATAGNQSATASWSPATTVPDGSPVSGYKVTAVNTANNVETSVNVGLCTTACSATIPTLANGATYRIEVRALCEAGAYSRSGTAPGTVSPSGVGVVRPAAPTGVAATAGSLADLPVDASVSWSAPAQPVGVTVEAWRITAYDATTLAPIKRVFLDEPTAAADAGRIRTVGFASARSVVFKVQAIATDDAGTMSAPSAASSAVTAQ
jgi:Fibronectin type III domain